MPTWTLDQRRAARAKRALDRASTYNDIERYMATIREAREALTEAMRAMLDRVVVAMEDGSLPVSLLTQEIGECHCLCGAHNRISGGICEATADFSVVLVGGLVSPSDRPMCKPCAQWWYNNRPERVEMFTRLDKLEGGSVSA